MTDPNAHNDYQVDQQGNLATSPDMEIAASYDAAVNVPAKYLEASTRKGGALKKAFLGAMTVAAVNLTSYGVVHSEPTSTSISAENESFSVDNWDQVSTVATGPIRADYLRALQVDTCSTKVSVEDATAMYQRLWLSPEKADMSAAEYAARTARLTSVVKADREALGIGQFPENFAALQTDADGFQKIPLSEYEATATSFLATRGIEAKFDWPVKSEDKGATAGGQAAHTSFDDVTPLRAVQKITPEVRKNIVSVIAAFANLPPAMFTDPQIKTLILGQISVKAAGFYANNAVEKAIALDIVKTPAYYFRSTTPHEGTHNLAVQLCQVILQGSQENGGADKAWASLNQGFRYSAQNPAIVNNDQLVAGQYTGLQAHEIPGGRVVSYRDYGMTSPVEDPPTDIGEAILDTDGITRIYERDARDKTIFQEKIALELARFAQRHPRDADYVVHLMELARLQAASNDLFSNFGEGLWALQSFDRNFTPGQQQPVTLFDGEITYQQKAVDSYSADSTKIFDTLDPSLAIARKNVNDDLEVKGK